MKKFTDFIGIAAVLVVGLFSTSELLAQKVYVPTGTIVDLRMDTGLNSGSSRVNDAFRATVTVSNNGPLRQRRNEDRALYVSANLVRGAQNELRQLHYYSGPSDGRLDAGTRRAIAHFQIDNNQAGTGDLDQETAVELGLLRYDRPGDGQGRGNSGNGSR